MNELFMDIFRRLVLQAQEEGTLPLLEEALHAISAETGKVLGGAPRTTPHTPNDASRETGISYATVYSGLQEGVFASPAAVAETAARILLEHGRMSLRMAAQLQRGERIDAGFMTVSPLRLARQVKTTQQPRSQPAPSGPPPAPPAVQPQPPGHVTQTTPFSLPGLPVPQPATSTVVPVALATPQYGSAPLPADPPHYGPNGHAKR